MNQVDIGWVAGILDGEGSVVLVEGSTKRKSDNRRAISSRILVASTDFEILEKLTELLSLWGISYTYTTMNYKVKGGDFAPKININVAQQDSVIKLLSLVIPFLTAKKERASLILEYTLWRKENSKNLSYRYGKIERSAQDIEQEYWNRYRKIFAGRGRLRQLNRKRDLRESVLLPSTPIHFPD